jgi:transcriptional regulator NrdR family protein
MNIRVSEKHGVNPSVLICPCCAEEVSFALMGRLANDAPAPPTLRDVAPCEKCQEKFESYREMGFVFIIVKDEYTLQAERSKEITPWQFFHGVVVVQKHVAEKALVNFDTTKGIAFLMASQAKQMGLMSRDGELTKPGGDAAQTREKTK